MTALLDRDREVAALETLVAGALEGSGRPVLIEGPSGIGKSGLLADLRTRGGGLRVLAARASELERTFAFGVVRQLFEADVATRRDAALAGAAAPAGAIFASEPGTGLRLARRPGDARGPLRRALELAGACDAAGLAEHVRTELYATGARPRTDALAGVAALTASELRIVERAATGETNRDIAQALFVTPKTVEVHLSNAYRKLGVRSRRELPGALA